MVTTQIHRINTLFDKDPEDVDLSIIIHFPTRHMSSEELRTVSKLREYGEFFIGYIDYDSDKTDIIRDYIVQADCLQTAVETLIGTIPFFDAPLN
jgi:hypothetical protein